MNDRVAIGEEVYHLTSSTKLVGGRSGKITLAEIDVPSFSGSSPVPPSATGVVVRYKAVESGGRLELVHLEVMPGGHRIR